jgi:hypothetical protein
MRSEECEFPRRIGMRICAGNAITRFAAGRFFAVSTFSLAGNTCKPL